MQNLFEEFLRDYSQAKEKGVLTFFEQKRKEESLKITYPYIAIQPAMDIHGAGNIWSEVVLLANNDYWLTVTQPHVQEDYFREELNKVIEATENSDNPKLGYIVGPSQTPIPLTFAVNIQDPRFKQAWEKLWSIQGKNYKPKFSKSFYLPNLSDIDDKYVDAKVRRHELLYNRPILSISSEDLHNPARTIWFDDMTSPASLQEEQTINPNRQHRALQQLSFFDALRTDYSLHRLQHYTLTEPKYFQPNVLFTNYQKYVEKFIEWALRSPSGDLEHEEDQLILPSNGGPIIKHRGQELTNEEKANQGAQMPAYHFKPKNSDAPGITLINIGVGPSNAKNITDHLAVLRPNCWIMVGHCGGIRFRQQLGQYILAQAYVRDDHVLDHVLPTWVPIPNIEELQHHFKESIKHYYNTDKPQSENPAKSELLRRQTELRIGTVFSTDDRNWELDDYNKMLERFELSRAVAIDMESATIAANGYRYRIPYAAFLCVSDRPLHGEIKMRDMAQSFYQEATKKHLDIAILAIQRLYGKRYDKDREGEEHPFSYKSKGKKDLLQLKASRKLRGLDDPLFR